MSELALAPVLPADLMSIDEINEELYYQAEAINPENRVRLVEILGEHASVLREITHWYAAAAKPDLLLELTTRMTADAREVLTLAGVHVPAVPAPPRPFVPKRGCR